MRDASAIETLTVLAPDGAPVPAAQLWADRPAVLGFVRHFG